MFGYAGTEHPELVKEFFRFVTTTESLQEILDNSPSYTNLDVNDDAVEQHWLQEEEEFMVGITDEQKQYSVLQTATKYTNDYWMQFGQIWLHTAQTRWKQSRFFPIWMKTVRQLQV